MSGAIVGTDGLKACCQRAENLQVIRSTATVTVRQCTVCGCKHHELLAEMLDLRAKVPNN